MRIKMGSGLWLITLVVIALIIVFNLTHAGIVYLILALPFALFLPGYVLLLALFPRKESLGDSERVALSFGLSIVIVALVGLALNYIWLGITLVSSFYSIAGVILVLSAVAGLRLKRLWKQARFNIEFNLRIPGWGHARWDRVITLILAISILGALGIMGYAIASPKTGETFTEFYVLGQEGEATDYPWVLKMGSGGKVTVGIINHESKDTNYLIKIQSDAVANKELGPVMLGQEERWEQEVDLVPVKVGEKQKVEFLLFRNGEDSPCESVHLWVSVSQE